MLTLYNFGHVSLRSGERQDCSRRTCTSLASFREALSSHLLTLQSGEVVTEPVSLHCTGVKRSLPHHLNFISGSGNVIGYPLLRNACRLPCPAVASSVPRRDWSSQIPNLGQRRGKDEKSNHLDSCGCVLGQPGWRCERDDLRSGG